MQPYLVIQWLIPKTKNLKYSQKYPLQIIFISDILIRFSAIGILVLCYDQKRFALKFGHSIS